LVDHRRHNGAALLGLQGLVFKSHGSADELAFFTAMQRAYDAAENDLLARVKSQLALAAPLMAAHAPQTF
jgi:glycerol-3-phosphate acyltransferase PlsX